MTLDEAIAKYKEKAECFKETTNVAYGLELEQIVEWLEDYRLSLKMRELNAKHLPKLEEAVHKLELMKEYEKGYNKAIDECMNLLGEHCMEQENDCSNLECPFCTDGCDIINIAERLKAGDNNE